ncbi:MAG: M15 family metallopeptidase [Leptolyngbya sp.]|nr:M15 family metallopeptidase [Leptolyngbya sp.]
MKPYQRVPIVEKGEPLVPLPLMDFAVVTPHPYVALGAPYGDRSPYWVRQGVLTALTQAQTHLTQRQPGWRLQIFDAYRPIAVQQFMVDHALSTLARDRGYDPAQLTPAIRQDLMATVTQFWAIPSTDPATPPPHSTGAAVDLTLVDATGQAVSMGSPIDEVSPRSYPHHFAQSADPAEQQAHRDRQLLAQVMQDAGFQQHPNEWWHFSLGDQIWAWQLSQQRQQPIPARYGATA